MKKFLTNYVKMIADNHETELTKEQITLLVDSLMENDELWDTFDSYIYDLLDRLNEKRGYKNGRS